VAKKMDAWPRIGMNGLEEGWVVKRWMSGSEKEMSG
jgi:hypothetical protein